MLLDYIGRYYKFLWLALIAITILKIILSYSFNEKIRGVHGVLYSIFKWYGFQEQEMEDFEPRKTVMRFHNIITLLMYFTLILLAIAIGLTKYIYH